MKEYIYTKDKTPFSTCKRKLVTKVGTIGSDPVLTEVYRATNSAKARRYNRRHLVQVVIESTKI